MAVNRAEVLKTMLAANPADSFARYGLAMEYVNSGALQEAVGEFQTLLTANPKYVAAYYHGGQALEKLGQLEAAGTLYRQGVKIAGEIGDTHARDEIQAALDILG
jgi:Tfp pilus assembly protein PilF